MTRPAPACLLAAALLLAGCGEQELYAGLTQRQANEMTALLRNSGIDADKQTREAGSYAVVAPRARFAEAIELLRANGYPRDGYESLGQVFKKDGFVSSPLEERARLVHALSQELSNTLASIDGVVVARVLVSVPERDPLAEKAEPSSASIFIKHRPGVDLSARLGQIKALVVNALPGLAYDHVTVALFAADAEPVPARPAPSFDALGPLAGSLAAIGVLVLGGAGALWWRQRRRQVPAVAARADAAAGAALVRVAERRVG